MAVLREFTLHHSGGRVEMGEVNVVKAGSRLFLIGRVKVEAVASAENPNIVIKTKAQRVARIRLVATRKGVLAFEGEQMLGSLVWDDKTNALKLPAFMRHLLGVQ